MLKLTEELGSEDLLHNSKLAQEIQRQKDRVSLLVKTVSDSAPLTLQRFKDGFFTQASQEFRDFVAHSEEIANLHHGIYQLSSELDYLEDQQLTFNGGVR